MPMKESTRTLLNPLDRAAEILFGLIMALTFTCSISVANNRETEIRQLLIAAIGCNLAWGLVDATMYLVGILARRSRNYEIFQAVRNSPDSRRAGKYISDSLPPIVASVIESNEMEQIRSRLISVPEPNRKLRLKMRDIQKAAAIFCIMVVSTLPVVLPFVFISDTNMALRVSNLVAIVMMFLCGWSVAAYVGFSKWAMSLAMILIGIILVAITILLGG
jgi:VIT1/CCC1 family predicted Fe2+/Mn2+ transporter